MKLNTGMRCHDLCPKMEMEKLFAQVREHDIRQIQLAFGKSISDYDLPQAITAPVLPGPLPGSWRRTKSMWLCWAAISILSIPLNPDVRQRWRVLSNI